MSKVCPLFSGSSGNSFYIGDRQGGILIDVGCNAKQTALALNDIGVEESAVKAVFITHEHSDHISGARVFCSRGGIPLYASKGTYGAIEAKGILKGNFFSYVIDSPVVAGNMQVSPFRTSHDSVESVGYIINTGDDRKIAVLTDTGFVTDEARRAVKGADLVLLESNHDVNMLQTGPYPYVLKQRILSETGHLSNDDCDEYAKELVKSGTTRIILAHLSRENNHPDLAFQSALYALTQMGAEQNKDYILKVASPRTSGDVTVL